MKSSPSLFNPYSAASRIAFMFLFVAIFMGCSNSGANSDSKTAQNQENSRPEWAIAIHGGAGVISKDLPEDIRAGYEASLEAALSHGTERLAAGESALDVVEAVVQILEDDPRFNAGRGAVYTAEGVHELDAAIMDGRNRAAGAVAGVTTVRHPISLARLVMEQTSHVLLMGAGAEAFADEMDLERVSNEWFDTDNRRRQLERAREREAERASTERASATQKVSLEEKASRYGTVGAVALDKEGNLAAATSTGGMTNKRFGRVGDVPVIGAGTYADNATAAISCTGTGEQFIRHVVAHQIASRMELAGESLHDAASYVVHQRLDPGDGGIIAVSQTGEIALVFNSSGMFRGAADANGRFEVAIWE